MIVKGSVRLRFSYAAGSVSSAYLAALREPGTILGARCAGCGAVACPARPLCPSCGASTDELVAVGPEGALVSWTEAPGRGTFGLVRLDGADTALLHRLEGGGPWRVGERVVARFRNGAADGAQGLIGFEALP